MKMNLRFFVSSLLVLLCSVVGRAATGDTYKLVTDASELKSGDIVVIASGTNAMGSINGDRTKIDPVTVAISDDKVLSWVEGLGETVLEGTANNWNIKFQGSYVTIRQPNSLTDTKLSFSSSTGHNYTIIVGSDGNTKLHCNATLSTRYLVFGKKAFEAGSEKSVQLYKKQRRANGIAFLSASAGASLSNETFALPISNPNNLPITYTSSNPYVATVGADGTATLKTWGTTTVTATFAGDDTYMQGSVSMTLSVTATKTDYTLRTIDFVAGVVKGNLESTGEDSMEKDVVTVFSHGAAFASSPYKLANARGTDIEVAKGNIVMIEVEGGDLSKVGQGENGGGNYDNTTFPNRHIWTGSAKKVSIKRNGSFFDGGTGDASVASFRVYVEYPDEKSADYNEATANYIEPWENTTVCLTRNLQMGKWNTLCLPFDLDGNELTSFLGQDAQIVEYKSTDADGTLKFESTVKIEAGKPYLVKPTNGIGTYTFHNIDVKTAQPESVGNGVTFQGIFSPKDITEGGTLKAAGVTEDAKIKLAATGSEMQAFRAYFVLPQTADPASLRLSIDGTVTAISGINADNNADDANAPVYNLQGQRVSGNLPGGVYIKNGRKFVVK